MEEDYLYESETYKIIGAMMEVQKHPVNYGLNYPEGTPMKKNKTQQ